MRQLGTPDEVQWFMPAVIFICGFIMAAGGIVEIFTIATGIKARRFDRLRAESEKRLADKDYVYIL